MNMPTISQLLQYILSKRYGEEVRGAIHDAIEKCYQDVNSVTLREDAFQAALQAAIDHGDIPGMVIADNSISGAKIQDGTIPLRKLSEPVLITADSALSDSSTNPVQNKVIKSALDEVNGSLAHISLSDEVKSALLDCFKHAAWVDNDGPNCYASLYDALYPNTSLDHITAVFVQGSFVVEPETPLNALKPYLTVTGHYKDGAAIVITGYILSGTLTAGMSTVTVTRDGKTATFNVNVTNNPALIYKLPSGTDISNRAIDTNVPVFGANDNFTILIKAHMNALPNDNNTKYLLNHGYLATGTLRLGLIFNANYKTLTFISNVMYQDNVPINITGNEYECNVMYVIRMRNKRVTKKFYIDSTCYIDKDEDISSYISDKDFTGDYMISAFAKTTETNGFFPGVVNLLAIYNSALSDDKIESIMGIEI